MQTNEQTPNDVVDTTKTYGHADATQSQAQGGQDSGSQSLVGGEETAEKTVEEKNLGSAPKSSEPVVEGQLFDVLDSLELDEDSKTYIANKKKAYDSGNDVVKSQIQKELATKFLSK